MFFYQAVCREHDFESSLYKSRRKAVLSAAAHRRQVPGTHDLKILKVYIPKSNMRVDSEDNL